MGYSSSDNPSQSTKPSSSTFSSSLRFIQLSSDTIRFLPLAATLDHLPIHLKQQIAVRHTQSTSKCVLIKIKASNPSAYRVSPSSLCLKPGEQDVISFAYTGSTASQVQQRSKQSPSSYLSTMKTAPCVDKFLLIAVEIELNQLHKSVNLRPTVAVAPFQSNNAKQQQSSAVSSTSELQGESEMFLSSNLKQQQRIIINVSFSPEEKDDKSLLNSNKPSKGFSSSPHSYRSSNGNLSSHAKSGEPSPAMTVITGNMPTTSHSSTLIENKSKIGGGVIINSHHVKNSISNSSSSNNHASKNVTQKSHFNSKINDMPTDQNNGNTIDSSTKPTQDSQYRTDYQKLVRKVLEYEKNFQHLEQEIKVFVGEKDRWNHSTNNPSLQSSSTSHNQPDNNKKSVSFAQILVVMIFSMIIGALLAQR